VAYKIDTRYFIFQIRAPGEHDTTFIISTYTINKVKYNNYFITINHVCHRLEQRAYAGDVIWKGDGISK
jgi:hypothetical protein